MISLIAGIIGTLIGLLASPNPVVGVICGAFFAVVGWALTGFKTAVPANTAVTAPRKEHSSVVSTGPSFLIEGHGTVSANQFGAMFVQQSYALTIATVDMLFKPGKPGTSLPLRQSVAADPLPARLFFTAMLVAAYFIYPMKKLKVDERTGHEIMDGAIAGLADLKRPDGKLFGREDIQAVQNLVTSFYDFMTADFDQPKSLDRDSQLTKAAPPKSTELLLSILVSHYNGGGLPSQTAVAQLKQRGFYDPAYALATQTIDDLAHIPSKTLSDLNIKFIPA
jgi:hypothetical protein